MAAGLVLASCVLAIVVSYKTVPTTNTTAIAFDTIIVLGSPADPDGRPSSEQRERVLAAVRELRYGRSRHLILTGGPTFGGSTEGQVMATVAEREGLPQGAIVVETRARNTIQNIYYSDKIMQQHGWHSAEVVSSPSHLPRAALILEHFPMQWRVRAARWPAEYDTQRIAARYLREAVGTAFLRWFGFRRSPFLPER